MRSVVAGMFVSLDGVVESPQEWQMPYFNEEMGTEIGAQMAQADALLLGRRTYEEFAAFWPEQGNNGPGAFMNNVPKFVVSTTLDAVEWQNSSLLKGDLAAEVTRLKQEPGKNILVSGSATLVGSLLQRGLLDELGLMVCPVLVGSGKRLFENGSSGVPMTLVSSRTLTNGVLNLTYRPAAA